MANLLQKVLNRISNRGLHSRLFLVSDGAGWILDEVANQLATNLPDSIRAMLDIQSKWMSSRNSIVHFIERGWAWDLDYLDYAPSNNKYVGLWWHGKLDSDDPHMLAALEVVEKTHYRLDRIQVPTTIALKTMRAIGVPEGKLVLLPEGLDTRGFSPTSAENLKKQVRQIYGIPQDAFVIGSFQKDGDGWGEGLVPKLIKGPDTFAEAMELLARRAPIFLLIPGPARGYLREKFSRAGIPFVAPGHIPSRSDLTNLYNALDLYVSPSRDEGGPAGVMEAMASGIPVVSTRSGIAVDIFGDRENGILVDTNDPDALAEACYEMMNNRSEYSRISRNGYVKIQEFDWQRLSQRYYRELYLPLL